MSKRKKILILSIMVVILGVAAFLNYILLSGNNNDDVGASGASESFFSSYRTIRQEERNEEILYLNSIIGLEGTEFANARAEAAEQKLKLVEIMETELLLEQLLRTRGYADAVVSVSILNDSINIIIKGDEVTRSDTAIIHNLLKTQMGAVPQTVLIYSTAA